MADKREFASTEWVEAMREVVLGLLGRVDLSGIAFAFLRGVHRSPRAPADRRGGDDRLVPPARQWHGRGRRGCACRPPPSA